MLMVSTSYPADATDWKGVFIRHMAGAIGRQKGLGVKLWSPPGELPEGVSGAATPEEAAWLNRLMSAGGISHLMRSGGLRATAAPIQLLRMLRACYQRETAVDLYHINWLQCATPLPRNRVPALITVLGNDLKLLRLPFMPALLRRVMRGRRVAICPNADWMHEPLQTAFGDLAEIMPVSFGIDPRWYQIERTPSTPPRWLAVTRLTADKLGPLFDWSAAHFQHGARELHLFGPMQEGIQVPEWVHYHGAASPEQLAADWFPGATGLITLSRHAEGRPQVMLEAMASGLPIIASPMAAHATIVQDGVTGRLCGSLDDYGRMLADMEEAAVNQRMGVAARQWAQREIGTWDDCARRYVTIYRRLLGQTGDE